MDADEEMDDPMEVDEDDDTEKNLTLVLHNIMYAGVKMTASRVTFFNSRMQIILPRHDMTKRECVLSFKWLPFTIIS